MHPLTIHTFFYYNPLTEVPEAARQAAKKSIVHLALGAITLGSAYYSSQSLGNRCKLMLSIAGLFFASKYYTRQFTKDILARTIQAREIETRIDNHNFFKVYHLMLISALTAGVAADIAQSNLVSGASFLYTAMKTGCLFSLLFGVEDIAYGLGYVASWAKSLLSLSIFIHENAFYIREELKERLLKLSDDRDSNLLPSIEEMPLELVEAFAAPIWLSETRVELSEAAPTFIFRAHFKNKQSELSDDTIIDLIKRLPQILTLHVLADALPEERFRRIAVPLLIPSSTIDLQQIKTDLETQKKTLVELKSNPSAPESQNALGKIAAVVKQHTDTVQNFQYLTKKLPKEPLPDSYWDLQVRINKAREDEPLAGEILKTLTDESEDSLKSQIWEMRVLPKQEVVEEEEIGVLDILTRYYFDLEDCRRLSNALNFSLNGQEFLAVSEYLAAHGLSNQQDFIDKKILEPRKDGQPLEKKDIFDRLIKFCNTHPVHPSAPSSPSDSPESSKASISSTTDWTQTLQKTVSVFYFALKGSLMAAQMYYYPISTSLGFFWFLNRLHVDPNFEEDPLFSFRSRFIDRLVFDPRVERLSEDSPQDLSALARRVYHELVDCANLRGFFPFSPFLVGRSYANAYFYRWRFAIQRRTSPVHALFNEDD